MKDCVFFSSLTLVNDFGDSFEKETDRLLNHEYNVLRLPPNELLEIAYENLAKAGLIPVKF